MSALTLSLVLVVCLAHVVTADNGGVNNDPEIPYEYRNFIRHHCNDYRERYCMAGVGDPDTFSPAVDGRMFLNFSLQTINGACEYLSRWTFCIKNTSMTPGCGDQYKDVPIDELISLVQTICYGPARSGLESLIDCANNEYIQSYIYGEVRAFGGYIRGLKSCKSDQEVDAGACGGIKRLVVNLWWQVRTKCGGEEANTLRFLMDQLSQFEDLLPRALANKRVSCAFLSESLKNIPIVGNYIRD